MPIPHHSWEVYLQGRVSRHLRTTCIEHQYMSMIYHKLISLLSGTDKGKALKL